MGSATAPPKTNGENETTAKSSREYADIETHNQREQTGDPNSSNYVQETGERITARAFRAPGGRPFPLILVKDPAHQKPTGKDGGDSGNETGNKGGAECIHRY